MHRGRYVLDERKNPIPEPDLMRWAKIFEGADRQVARTSLAKGGHVSTVFLGLDHNFGDGPPLLFESMVFDPLGESLDQDRCSTWAQAEAMHARMVAEHGGALQ